MEKAVPLAMAVAAEAEAERAAAAFHNGYESEPKNLDKASSDSISKDDPDEPDHPEEKILQEFKSRIETALKNGDFSHPTQPIAAPKEEVSIWGVPISPSKEDPRTDTILLKFLHARDCRVDSAYEMLKNTLFWRQKFGAHKILEEEHGTDFDGVSFMHGFDKKGHPVCYNVFGAFENKDLYEAAFGDQSKTQKFLRWRVQLLEKGIQLLDFSPGGVNAFVQVSDFKNSPGLLNKEFRSFTLQALDLMQDNYPELVFKHVLLNVPWYFSALFAVISPFMTQRTKSKFELVGGGKVTEYIFKLIPSYNVPVRYGGLSRENAKEFEGIHAPVTELTLKPGEKRLIEIYVTEIGATVVWDLNVIGWEVSYGAEFIPELENHYTTVVEKTRKVASLEEPILNSFKTREAGKLVLSIDNTQSRKKKLSIYRYLVKN